MKPEELRSLAWRTDLIFARYEGEVLERRDYLVIRTLSHPNYFWGNYLLFREPPGPGDLVRWNWLYQAELAEGGPSDFVTLGWDDPEGRAGEVGPFTEMGFERHASRVLTASSVDRPPKYNDEIRVRPVTTDRDWEGVVETQLNGLHWYLKPDTQRDFVARRAKVWRKMSEAGLGRRFGAFLGNRLVGDLGIYFDREAGRFNSVATHRDFLRQGVCGTLVYLSSLIALREMGAKYLVMVADEDYHAAAIYESVGFRPTERQASLEWFDRRRFD